MIHQLVFLLLIFTLFSCNRKEEQNPIHQRLTIQVVHTPNSSDWRKMKYGLYMSPKGELGFASNEKLVNFSKSELQSLYKGKEFCENRFLKTLNSDSEISLNEVIDTSTFTTLGAGYFKDKNNIYSYYATCDGGFLNVFSSDTSSFKLLNEYYLSYKNEIYYYRSGKINADFKTFKVSDEFGMLAIDKNSFYDFGEKISEDKLIENGYSISAIMKLKKLHFDIRKFQ